MGGPKERTEQREKKNSRRKRTRQPGLSRVGDRPARAAGSRLKVNLADEKKKPGKTGQSGGGGGVGKKRGGELK